jgi:hypothetical protein
MPNPRGGILSAPVPASEVMHQYCMLRPGQVRGAMAGAGHAGAARPRRLAYDIGGQVTKGKAHI